MCSIDEQMNDFKQKLIKLNEFKIFYENYCKIENKLNENINKVLLNDLIESENILLMNLKNCKIKENCFENRKRIKCFWPKCQFKTECQSELERHKSMHFNKNQFKCDFDNCYKTFKRRKHLNCHQLNHSNIKKYICDWNECNKNFKNKSLLIRHKRCVHLNERQFKYD